MKMRRPSLGLALAFSSWVCEIPVINAESLLFPTIVQSDESGVLEITLTIEYANVSLLPELDVTLQNTRLFNGTCPGPTLLVNSGDLVRIRFENNLVDANNLQQQQLSAYVLNQFGIPDESNLHYHGVHVSGEMPSDDTHLRVEPGDFFQYETRIPSYHMPGTHWIHPHVHGSSALQVGGGASLALIVQDKDYPLPDVLTNATDMVLVVQTLNLPELEKLVQSSGGSTQTAISKGAGVPDQFRILNGQYQPVMELTNGEWKRWRIIHAGWLVDPLDLSIVSEDPNMVDASHQASCEMKLVAKDGIYIRDNPRQVTGLPIPTGGRADVMVRCVHDASVTTTSQWVVKDGFGQIVWTMQVLGSSPMVPFDPWTPTYPSYLEDLTAATVTAGCTCSTQLHGGCSTGFCVNGRAFENTQVLHQVALDSINERKIHGIKKHPYHQHVYPFQLMDNIEQIGGLSTVQKEYYARGDWHDSLMISNHLSNSAVIRYNAQKIPGKVMVHCHRLIHEDQGMMSQEQVVADGECRCSPETSHARLLSPTTSPLLLIVGMCLVTGYWIRFR